MLKMNSLAKAYDTKLTTKQKRIRSLLEEAVAHHQNGHLAQAKLLYRKAAQADPKNPVTLQLLGVLAAQEEEYELSLSFFSRAISLLPTYSEAFLNRGHVFKKLGKIEEAIKDYGIAISIAPETAIYYESRANLLKESSRFDEALNDYNQAVLLDNQNPELYFNRGNILRELNLKSDALKSFDIAISIRPNYEDAIYNRAHLLEELGRFNEALDSYDAILEENPFDKEVLNNRANVLMSLKRLDDSLADFDMIEALNPNTINNLNNRGTVLKEKGEFNEALKDFNKSLEINPNHTETLNNRGVVFKELRRFDEALVDFDKAISLDGSYAEVLNNRSIVYRELGRFDESIKDLDKAISLKPDFEKAYNNRGNTQRDLQHFDLAIEDYNHAIQLDPEYVDAYWNKALCMLHLGDFGSGWPLYEWRWKRDKSISGEPITTTKPMWSGESDKTIFLWSEQGIGDEIMFASLLPELQQTSTHVILNCDKRLIPLFKRSFMGNISFCDDKDTVDENSYDFHIPIGSLPLILRPTLSSFKEGSKAYLKCQQSKADELKLTLLGKQKEILVGISWLSKSRIPGAIQRNVELAEIAQHLNKPNIKLVNLQYGDVSGEIKNLKDNQNIDVIQIEEIDNKNDIDGLAALIMACDHIVTIDNATAHLASALGAKTKLLLPINHDWRWGQEKTTSYWYDSLQLYRQRQLNDWETNLLKISSEIQSKHN